MCTKVRVRVLNKTSFFLLIKDQSLIEWQLGQAFQFDAHVYQRLESKNLKLA
jgi:hypothetical protein